MTSSTERTANSLINEKSPYLLQHAHNPVDWLPWGTKAFEKARREDKLVFLSIGYSTCHWCHVMEREVFEDSGCAALLNADFVSIKVDREERPDVDNIYMEACQTLTGSGGWPLSIFLTPDKLPFFAGTYIPKERFKSILLKINDTWNSNRRKIKSAALETTNRLGRESLSGVSFSANTPTAAYEALKLRFDFKHGGFGGAPKFPSAHTLMFLMRYATYYKRPDAMRMADFTMEKMAQGGIFDHIGGGFCRYSTDKYFLIPHFEKMLYDNAMLALVYTEARRFAAARRVLDYCIAEMRDNNGGFYTAQDADSEGIEGKFYSFSPAEVRSVLGGTDGNRFCELYAITENGNFENKSIPNLLAHGNLSFSDEEFSIACRTKLYEYRSKRIPPLKDDKVLVSSNGLMIAALSTAGRMMRDSAYIEHAKTAARFILENMSDGSRLYSVWRGDRLPHKATLDDYAYLAWGLFRLHQATLEKSWLDTVISLCADIERLFSEGRGALYHTGNDVDDLPLRLKSGFDGALPSGNSIAAGVFLRLWQLTGDEHYRSVYSGIIGALAGDAGKYPTAFCSLLSSFMLSEHGGVKVELNDAPEKYSTVMSHFRPFTTWTSADGGEGAHICHEGACRPPVSSPEELNEQLKSLEL